MEENKKKTVTNDASIASLKQENYYRYFYFLLVYSKTKLSKKLKSLKTILVTNFLLICFKLF